MAHIKDFSVKMICLVLVLSGILAACTASSSLPPPTQTPSQPARTLLTADALTNGFTFDGPVEESALTPPDDSYPPTHTPSRAAWN